MSRTFEAIASSVSRAVVHQVNLMAREKRRLSANFRAVMPAGATITRAQWDMHIPGDVAMSAGQIAGPRSSVLIEAVLEGGGAELRCQVTLSTGDVLAQYFVVLIGSGPIFRDSGVASGASQIIVNA
ncbi:MAG: hypothetical protein ACRCTO_23115 [Pseudomonas paracarnis]